MLWSKNHAENKLGELVPDLFLFPKKALYEVKAMVCSLVSMDFIALNLAYNKNKLQKYLDYWSRDMLDFYSLEKGLGIVSPAYFVYDFSTKMFLILFSINWPNFIPWLPLLLEILGNMYIAIVCYPGIVIWILKLNLSL